MIILQFIGAFILIYLIGALLLSRVLAMMEVTHKVPEGERFCSHCEYRWDTGYGADSKFCHRPSTYVEVKNHYESKMIPSKLKEMLNEKNSCHLYQTDPDTIFRSDDDGYDTCDPAP